MSEITLDDPWMDPGPFADLYSHFPISHVQGVNSNVAKGILNSKRSNIFFGYSLNVGLWLLYQEAENSKESGPLHLKML